MERSGIRVVTQERSGLRRYAPAPITLKGMDRAWLNEAKKLAYRDPSVVLRELRSIELAIASSGISPQVRHLRTNDLKKVRELRHAALFCYGMSRCIEQPVYFAPIEAADYDFVATWGEMKHFAPVQLKELVPEELNETSTVQGLVDRLTKYSSSDLTVAIFLNRRGQFSPTELCLPRLHIAALWFVFAIAPDQSKWQLVGDFMEAPAATTFAYPS